MVLPIKSFSQNFGGCATPPFEESYLTKQFTNCNYSSDAWFEYRSPDYWIPDENTPLKTILVNWVILRDDNGENGWQDTQQFRDQVALMFSHLNEWYSNSQPKGYILTCEPNYTHIQDTRIRFELNEIIFIDSTVFNQTCWANPTILNYIHSRYPSSKNALNHIFTQPSNDCLGNAWGYYSVGVGNSAFVQTWYSMYSTWFVVWDDHINHIAHEYGHAVGLHHTYDSEVRCLNHYDFLDDVFGLCAEPSCSPCSKPQGCSDDHICYLTYNCFFQNHSEPYPIMSGKNNSRYISPKSAGRMHRALSLYGNTFLVNNRPMHKYVKENYSSLYSKTISESEFWDFPIKLYQDILIQPYKSLSIECELQMVPQSKITISNSSLLIIDGMAFMEADNYIIIEPGGEMVVTGTLDMGKHGRIIVKPGAKLTVNGGIITSSFEFPWQGIYVEGDRTLPQTFANQGALILLNGAIIENAIDAVKLRGVQDNWWSNGGIIQATDATFRNNWRNVEFLSYQNVNSQGQEIDNISFFHNCTFLTDSNTPHLEHTSNVSMWNVKGVRFTNCNFTDLRTQLDYTAYRQARDGILSSTAEFYVNQCNFSGQKYGVYATSSQSHRMFSVNHSDFDTYRGIYFNSVNNVIIRNNHFNVDPGYTYQGGRCDDTYGLYIDQSTMFVVENNSFTSFSNGSTICGSVGLIARSTGSHTNEIYRNNFSGFTVGIETIGSNRGNHQDHGLLIKCNNFETSAWDIFVSEKDHGRHQGIRQSQGSSTSHSTTDLAGNLFGNNSPILVANYVNQGNPIAYYHHNPSSEPRVLPSVVSGPITLWPSISDYNASESCPVRIAKKTFELLANEMNAAQMQYEETNLFLLAYTDDGNTHLMTQQVEMAGSGNAYQTYQYLLQTSPFLSEEVLTALAAKEEGFNKAMIRDVLVENPQAAKSEEVNLTLDSRQDPLPAYMRWQINNGLYHLSEKEIMQQFMYLQKTRHDLALNEVIRGIVNQHEGFENAPTLDELLASVNDIRYQYLRAEYRFAKGDYVSGMQLLNQISQHYPIPTDEAMQAHQEKVSFYSLLAQWNSDEYPDFTNLPEEVLAQLETFLEATPHVAGKALSLLMLNQAIEYEEPIVYPTEEMLPKSGKVHSIADILLPEMAHEFRFSLYPNPSREYLTLDWCVESPRIAESGKIEIRNASGVLVHTMETHTPCNQQILPLAGWKSGTYTATLKLGSQLRKTITFVVAQ